LIVSIDFIRRIITCIASTTSVSLHAAKNPSLLATPW